MSQDFHPYSCSRTLRERGEMKAHDAYLENGDAWARDAWARGSGYSSVRCALQGIEVYLEHGEWVCRLVALSVITNTGVTTLGGQTLREE